MDFVETIQGFTKVFFFREILRFLRNFGGFIAKMRSKMTKMRVLRGNRLFFFCMTVSVKLGRIFAVSRVLGVENLKPMVVSLKLGVLAMLKAEGL